MTDKVGTGAENTEFGPLLRMLRMISVSRRRRLYSGGYDPSSLANMERSTE